MGKGARQSRRVHSACFRHLIWLKLLFIPCALCMETGPVIAHDGVDAGLYVWSVAGDRDGPAWYKLWSWSACAAFLAAGAGLGWRGLRQARLRRREFRCAHQQWRQAEQASAAKSDFLATMSHEIRTPLHGLMGMLDMLERSGLRPEQRGMFQTLQQSGRQLRRILDEVLDLSRIEAGHVVLVREAFEPVLLLEQVLDLHAPNAACKRLDLRLRLASDFPVIAFGDPDRLAQVIGNLLNNAIKFTSTGWVELAARRKPDGVSCFSVSDTGPGVDQRDQARLFEPYVQLETPGTCRNEGSGLGLAICRRLADSMDGRIELDSRPGRGSRFRILLPLDIPLGAGLPATALLAHERLAAVVSPHLARILLRLSRRWGFQFTRLQADGRMPPPDCTALLLEAGATPAGPGTSRHDLNPAVTLLVLSPPWAQGPDPEFPADVRYLRWPLNESRLIAALLDIAFERRQTTS